MKKIILLAILLATSLTGYTQVGIGTNSPHTSAALEVQSTNLGFLPPRMTSVQMNAIPNPAEGLMVYCLDCFPKDVYVFGGTNFNTIGSGATTITSISITTNATTFSTGDQIIITVLDNLGNDITSTSQITIGGNPINSNPFILTNPGNFDVIANHQAFTSNNVNISVSTTSSRIFTTKVLLNEFTGTWDGATPVAGEAVKNAKSGNPNIIPVGYHNGDTMTNSDATAVENAYNITGFPTVKINGAAGEWTWSNYPIAELDPFLNTTQPLGLAINSTISGNNLNIAVKVGFANITNTNLKLTVYLVEDGIVASQSNYYVNTQPNPWVNYIHDNTLRKAYTAAMGDVIPSGNIIVDTNYTRNFTNVAIPAGVNTANLRLVAFVSDSANNVLNTQTAAIGVNKNFD